MRGVRPTRKQKILMKEWHIDPENWLVVRETAEELVIVHRLSGQERYIIKD